MSLGNIVQDVEALVALGPVLFKFIEDARAAAPQLEADAEELKTKLEAIFHSTPAVIVVTPPPAA